MTTAGWIFLGVAWTTILVVLVFCYCLILRKPAKPPEAGPFNM